MVQTLREALRGVNLPLRGVLTRLCGGLFEGSTAPCLALRASAGPEDFPRVVTLCLETNLASRWKGVRRLPELRGKTNCDFPGTFPELVPGKFFGDFPGSSLQLWNLTASPGSSAPEFVPQYFPGFVSPVLPRKFPELPRKAAPFSGKPDILYGCTHKNFLWLCLWRLRNMLDHAILFAQILGVGQTCNNGTLQNGLVFFFLFSFILFSSLGTKTVVKTP